MTVMNADGTYHSPLRASQTAATRERIVEACVALMQQGDDLTYAGVVSCHHKTTVSSTPAVIAARTATG